VERVEGLDHTGAGVDVPDGVDGAGVDVPDGVDGVGPGVGDGEEGGE